MNKKNEQSLKMLYLKMCNKLRFKEPLKEMKYKVVNVQNQN